MALLDAAVVFGTSTMALLAFASERAAYIYLGIMGVKDSCYFISNTNIPVLVAGVKAVRGVALLGLGTAVGRQSLTIHGQTRSSIVEGLTIHLTA